MTEIKLYSNKTHSKIGWIKSGYGFLSLSIRAGNNYDKRLALIKKIVLDNFLYKTNPSCFGKYAIDGKKVNRKQSCKTRYREKRFT